MLYLACRFHPSCLNFTPDQVKKMEQFVCPDCSSPGGEKKPRQSSPTASPPPDHPTKVIHTLNQESPADVLVGIFCYA